ncbi:hypothetical protein PHET_09966 [Paragonimus heterotremus]|uniref:CRC domain-containing protein n=1 Tax=Paragonimus heterotremus TaxID=100268 RepID=A0A8J4SLQ7_9TREM|nr:hypothetical protein PHET_09966 [Paragonimus heterotremus]
MSEPFFDDREQEYLVNTLQKQKDIAIVAEFEKTFVDSQEDDNILFTQSSHDFKYQSDENKLDDAALSKLYSTINGTATYKKPCNCTKSHCLKLYCECFARGIACDNCNCSNCMNNVIHEEARRRAIKSTLERNPLAFHPKIGTSSHMLSIKPLGESDRKHSKGCNCKRSGCLKNYCECYEVSFLFLFIYFHRLKSAVQICVVVKAVETMTMDVCKGITPTLIHRLFPSRKVLIYIKSDYLFPLVFLSPAIRSAVCFEHANSNVINGQMVRLPHANQAFGRYATMHENLCSCSYSVDEPIMPNGFLSMEVTEAACGCMLAQLDEAKQRSFSPVCQERVVLEEFGKCLEQILESAAKVPHMSTYTDASNYSTGEAMHDPDFITILSNTNSQNSHPMQLVNSEQVNHIIYTCDENSQSNLNLISRDLYAEPELGLVNYSNLTDSSLAGHFTYPNSLTPAAMQKHVELPMFETAAVTQPYSMSGVYPAEFMGQSVVRMLNMLDGTSEERPNTLPITHCTQISVSGRTCFLFSTPIFVSVTNFYKLNVNVLHSCQIHVRPKLTHNF